MLLTPEQLKEIEQRAEAATAPPWAIPGHSFEGTLIHFYQMPNQADSEFIAHAREDVPALIAEVRRSQAIIEAAQQFRLASEELDSFSESDRVYKYEDYEKALREVFQRRWTLFKLLTGEITVQPAGASGEPQGWIPVTERLPLEYTQVLVFSSGLRLIETAYWYPIPQEWRFSEYQRCGLIVTHWQPLPEPPTPPDTSRYPLQKEGE